MHVLVWLWLLLCVQAKTGIDWDAEERDVQTVQNSATEETVRNMITLAEEAGIPIPPIRSIRTLGSALTLASHPYKRYGDTVATRLKLIRGRKPNTDSAESTERVDLENVHSWPMEWKNCHLYMDDRGIWHFNYTASESAIKLYEENQRRLERIRQLLASKYTQLCSGPWMHHPSDPSTPLTSRAANVSLRWLHIPKTGTSFANTLLPWASSHCRHNKQKWPADILYLGAPMAAFRPYMSLNSRVQYKTKAVSDTRVMASVYQRFCPQGGLLKIDWSGNGSIDVQSHINKWAEHDPIFSPYGVASIFRSPNQRVLSAFHFGKHIWGASRLKLFDNYSWFTWREWIQKTTDALPEQLQAAAFASTPGIYGTATRMLNGCGCSAKPIVGKKGMQGYQECPFNTIRPSTDLSKSAALKVQDMPFVGIQEFFNASVCLFHKKFGGEPFAKAFSFFNIGNRRNKRHKRKKHAGATAPVAGESHGKKDEDSGPKPYTLISDSDARKHTSAGGYEESTLLGFVDEMDEIVYAAALDRFERDVREVLGMKKE